MFPYLLNRQSAARLLDELVRQSEFGFLDLYDAAVAQPIPVQPHGPVEAPKLLSQREAAQAAGVCEKTLFNARRNGELRAVKIGTRVLYDPRDLNVWIERGKTVGSKCSIAV